MCFIICVCTGNIRANPRIALMLPIWSDLILYETVHPLYYVSVITPNRQLFDIVLLLASLTSAAICDDVWENIGKDFFGIFGFFQSLPKNLTGSGFGSSWTLRTAAKCSKADREQAVSLVVSVIHWTVDLPLREMMNNLVPDPGPQAPLSLSAVCGFTFSSHSITLAAIGW